jgi:dihydropyrimidinase
MFDLIIKNGTIVTASDIYIADVGIKDEKIVAIGKGLTSDRAEVVDAKGKYIFPGAIDPHVHLQMPYAGTQSSDDFKSGTIAAACGGTTTIIDFCTQERGQTLKEAIVLRQQEAQDRAVIDYGFHVAVTDVNEQVLAEIKQLIAQGYPSYKLYMTYDNLRLDDEGMKQVMQCTKEAGGLVCVHAEDNDLVTALTEQYLGEGKTAPKYHPFSRPTMAEGKAVLHAINLAKPMSAPIYFMHVTCRESLEAIRHAREQKFAVMGETCPQYLLLSDEKYQLDGFEAAKFVLTPPLRDESNQALLWLGLCENVLQVVSTDHCPTFFKNQKTLGKKDFTKIPSGLPGIELRFSLLYKYGVNAELIDLKRLVEITATNPAKIFGMYPQKGSIEVGADADLVIFDPKLKKTVTHEMLHENVDYTPYEGFKLTGCPIMTLSRGKIIVKNGEFVGKAGEGKFIKRSKPLIL